MAYTDVLLLRLVAVCMAGALSVAGGVVDGTPRKWGHLPRAYLPQPHGEHARDRGNANSASAQRELTALADRLLVDPPSPYPWQRVVRNASAYGAKPNDGLMDDGGLKRAIAAACDESRTKFQMYLDATSKDPSVPRMPDGPEDVGILVELRFSPGQYDLAAGLFQYNELANCSHLLLNGQNASITSHFQAGATAGADSPALPRGRTNSWLFATKGSHHVAILDFVFDTFEPATTMGQIRSVVRNASGTIVSMDVSIREHHATWADKLNASWFTTLQPVTEDGAFNVYGQQSIGQNAHYGGWTGLRAELCGVSCMRVSPSTASWSASGCNRDGPHGQATCNNLTAGAWVGLVRGATIGIGQFEETNVTIVQSVRSIGIGADITLYRGGQNAELIDIHNDRLLPDTLFVWNDNHGWPGQANKRGRLRIWHSSIEAGSDDVLDDIGYEADVSAVYRHNRTVHTIELHGRHQTDGQACTTGIRNYGDLLGQKVEVAHAETPYAPYATLTIAAVDNCPRGCGTDVTFEEDLPTELVVTDFMSVQSAPALLSVRNVRAGNHMYNVFNVKAQAMEFEDCFFYNATMGAVDVSTDANYWYEGPRANNIAVRSSSFEHMASAISIVATVWGGNEVSPPVQTRGKMASSAMHNVSIIDNDILTNTTSRSGSTYFIGITVNLGAIQGLVFKDNRFSVVPGMRRDLPLIQLCNVRDVVVSNNSVAMMLLSEGQQGGDDCGTEQELYPAQQCEPFPLGKTLLLQEGGVFGCSSLDGTTNVTVDPVTQPWWTAVQESTNHLHLRFDPSLYHPDPHDINPASQMPYMNARQRAVAPTAERIGQHLSLSHSSGSAAEYALRFDGTQFVDLTSAWNGFSQPTNSLSMGGSSFSFSLKFIANPGQLQEEDQVLVNFGHDPHECGSLIDPSTRPATERYCSGLFLVAITGGDTVIVQYTAGGYPYNTTQLSAPATANQWHHLGLNYTVVSEEPQDGPHDSVGASSSSWELWLDGVLVSQLSRQPLWHRGIASIALLGKAEIGLHGQAGSYFNGSIAALDVMTHSSDKSATQPAVDAAVPPARPTMIGMNYNFYRPCDGPASNPRASYNITFLHNWRQPGVRSSVQAQLANMSKRGVQSLRTMVFYFSTADERPDGVIALLKPGEADALVQSVGEFIADASSAGISRVTISFNPMSLNSPLDYVRQWSTCPLPCPTPPFDPKYEAINYEFQNRVRAAAVAHASDGLEVLFDLLNEADTAVLSKDANASLYVARLWKRWTDEHGADEASFTPIARQDGSGFKALLDKVYISGAPFPRLHMFQYYAGEAGYGPTTDPYPSALTNILSHMGAAGIPQDRRSIQISETFYSHAATARIIWHMNRDRDAQIVETLGWAVLQEQLAFGACAQIAPEPYNVDITRAILRNGVKEAAETMVADVVYDAPSMNFLLNVTSGKASEPLLFTVSDSNGVQLRSAARIEKLFFLHGPGLTRVVVPASSEEHARLARTALTLQMWLSDGRTQGNITVAPCGVSYDRCGGVAPRASSLTITNITHDVQNTTITVSFATDAYHRVSSVDIMDGDNVLRRRVTAFASADETHVAFGTTTDDRLWLGWNIWGPVGRAPNMRLRLWAANGAASQTAQVWG